MEHFHLKDDGKIPNSRYPLIVHRSVFTGSEAENPENYERLFSKNEWPAAWRNGVYPYHHYHSTAHEVLGVYSGTVRVKLGGESGIEAEAKPGDVIVIPAGVGHKRLETSGSLGIVGAYPNGQSPDLCTDDPSLRPGSDRNIQAVQLPKKDPVLGSEDGINTLWSSDLHG